MKRSSKILLAGGLLTGAAAACYSALKTVADLATKRDSRLYEKHLRPVFQEEFLNGENQAVVQAGYDWLMSQPVVTTEIESRDGLRLAGHLLTCPDAKRVEILFPGWREHWNDYMGLIAQYLVEHGTSVLIVEQRAQGESEGAHMGFGVLERYDCQCWAKYAAQRFPELPLYLGGCSMGATTVLMASALELPKQVRGFIADCGFTSPGAIAGDLLSKHTPLPEKPVLPLINQVLRTGAGFSLRECSTVEALKENERPVLFIHGDADKLVPLAMTLENYLACRGSKELLIVEGAGHGESFLVDRDGYTAALEAFFAAND